MAELAVPLCLLLPRWEVEGEDSWESHLLLEAERDTLAKRG